MRSTYLKSIVLLSSIYVTYATLFINTTKIVSDHIPNWASYCYTSLFVYRGYVCSKCSHNVQLYTCPNYICTTNFTTEAQQYALSNDSIAAIFIGSSTHSSGPCMLPITFIQTDNITIDNSFVSLCISATNYLIIYQVITWLLFGLCIFLFIHSVLHPYTPQFSHLQFNNMLTYDSFAPFNSDCMICLSPLHKCITTLPCKHSFHKKCIRKWFEECQNCPICRTTYS